METDPLLSHQFDARVVPVLRGEVLAWSEFLKIE